MSVSVADVRAVDQLVGFIRDGGQPKYLLFWGHQPPSGGGAGKGGLSQWWPATFAVDNVMYLSAEHFMMAAKARLFGDDLPGSAWSLAETTPTDSGALCLLYDRKRPA